MIQRNVKYILILFFLQINTIWANCPLLLFGNKVEPKPMTYKEDGNLSIFMINLSGEEIVKDDDLDSPNCIFEFNLTNIALKDNNLDFITSQDSEGNNVVSTYFDIDYNMTTTIVSLTQKEVIPADVGFNFVVNVDITGQSSSISPQNGFDISLNGASPGYQTYTYTASIPLQANDDENIMIDGDMGGIAITDITANDTINSKPVTLGNDVIIAEINNTTPLVINSHTGSVTVLEGTLGGLYTATYKLCETYDSTHCSDANISVHVQNHAPIGEDDNISIIEDTRVTIKVLVNDTDADEDRLKILSLTQPSHGIVAINSFNTEIEYRPDSSYNGFDSFTYVVSDGNGGTDEANVTIEIQGTNVAPNASNDYDTTKEDHTITIAVLENDIDTDGDSINIISITQPTHGSVVMDSHNLLYTPELNYNGEDVFTYTITDNMEHNDSAVVTMHVLPVNDLPTAVDDNVTMIQNTNISIDVLTNDRDVESYDFTIVLVTAPHHGKVSIKENQTVTYTPEFDYNGTDSFTYVMADEENATDIGEVNIYIIANLSPQVEDDNLTASIGERVIIDVLANDRDEENATDITSVQILGSDETGILTISGEGTWQVSSEGEIIFTPEESFIGDPHTIKYTVADELGNRSEPATVKINYIQENPQTLDDSIIALPGMTVIVKVLENDTDDQEDIDVGTLRILDVENNITVESLYVENQGTWSVDSYGTITFEPETDLLSNPTPIYYLVSDVKGHSSKRAKIEILYPVVEPTFQPTPTPTPTPTYTVVPTPIVIPEAKSTSSPKVTERSVKKPISTPNTVLESCQINANNDLDVVITSEKGTMIGVLFNDTCIEKCGTLSFTQGLHGTVSMDDGGTADNVADDVLIYVPDADIYDTTDSFEYTITDCSGHSAMATVSLRISYTKKKSSSGDALSYISMVLMMMLFGGLGVFYIREEEYV